MGFELENELVATQAILATTEKSFIEVDIKELTLPAANQEVYFQIED